ncbi:MAG: type II toxin-antitoxin system RelE/ParE family toxin [Eggerthellaceae bacterium]|nr:type II toxin-antitoxin system RelE/ParE family toxin [Eggerthellaceae bacterium]MBQ9068835.1 type II toxin-antitoxin system RelE/ParE family toxin [Eggerthellaceae bacterium]
MWEIDYTYIEEWIDTQEPQEQYCLFAAAEILAQQGPVLDRPLVDSIHGSAHANMKELRPASPGTSEIRVLFAFDPNRMAIMLLGGDKSGANNPKARGKDKWAEWYKSAIPKADRIYSEHLASLKNESKRSKDD